MNALKIARSIRGLTQSELAKAMRVSNKIIELYECCDRPFETELLYRAADALKISAAYLRGEAQKLAVYDSKEHKTYACPIISESVIGSYGIFYLVEVPEREIAIAVIFAGGRQLTTKEWNSAQPTQVSEIQAYRWFDADGNEVEMS